MKHPIPFVLLLAVSCGGSPEPPDLSEDASTAGDVGPSSSSSSSSSSPSSSETGPRPACGDGTVDDDEVCDDGNTLNYDGCSADCSLSAASQWTWLQDAESSVNGVHVDEAGIITAVGSVGDPVGSQGEPALVRRFTPDGELELTEDPGPAGGSIFWAVRAGQESSVAMFGLTGTAAWIRTLDGDSSEDVVYDEYFGFQYGDSNATGLVAVTQALISETSLVRLDFDGGTRQTVQDVIADVEYAADGTLFTVFADSLAIGDRRLVRLDDNLEEVASVTLDPYLLPFTVALASIEDGGVLLFAARPPQFMQRFDSDLNLVWQREYAEHTWNSAVECEGDFVVAGARLGDPRPIVAVLNGLGALVWERVYDPGREGLASGSFHDVVIDRSGAVVAGGVLRPPDPGIFDNGQAFVARASVLE